MSDDSLKSKPDIRPPVLMYEPVREPTAPSMKLAWKALSQLLLNGFALALAASMLWMAITRWSSWILSGDLTSVVVVGSVVGAVCLLWVASLCDSIRSFWRCCCGKTDDEVRH